MSIYFSLDTHLLSDKMADPTLEVTSYIIKNPNPTTLNIHLRLTYVDMNRTTIYLWNYTVDLRYSSKWSLKLPKPAITSYQL